MGLMFVLGLGLLVMGMAALAHALLTTTLDTSSRHVSREQALNLAEQGIDQTVARLNADGAYSTDAWAGTMPATVVTAADEKAWVRAKVAAAPAAAVEQAPGGDVVVVKPSNRGVVYAAAWVPSRAAATSLRVLRTEYVADGRYQLSHAILVDGDLSISGAAQISGLSASVHSNGDADISGSPDIAGSLTASGSFTRLSGSVAGTTAAGVPRVSVPQIDPRTLWNRNAGTSLAAASWYDLCPDGTVRRPTGAAPCAGTILGSGALATYRGWRLSGTTWSFTGDASFGGVYYAYGGDIKVTGNAGSAGTPWQVTLIAEDLAGGAGTDGCRQRRRGDIDIGGGVSPTAFLDGLVLVAGRDLILRGTVDQVLTGIVTAREQVDISGNATLQGVVVAQSRCDSGGSPVSLNTISGSMSLRYDGGLGVSVDEGVRTTLWSEL